MKKFLSLLMAFMLIVSLAVPAGATGGMMSYNGVELPDIESVWTNKSSRPYAFIMKNWQGNYMLYLLGSISENYYHDVVIINSNVVVKYKGFTNYELSDGKWVQSGNNDGVSSEFYVGEYVWSSFNIYTDSSMTEIRYPAHDPHPVMCDGSSCPAIDVNIDGSCDDCGKALMSLSRSPVAPDVTGSNKNYVMFYSGTVYKYTVYTSDESYTIRGEEYGARYRTYTDPSVTVQRYESYDGINWEQTYTGKTANDYPGEIGYELISSTFDWYTEAGDRFFPVPLWEEVETVTQGEMSNLTAETAGTMKTLVVCGVGLMALLMALSLFGKRWLLFLR